MKIAHIALALSLFIQAGDAKSADVKEPHNHPQEVFPAVHGMVLFGDEQLYASHIPMFMIPHDWQALFKVTLKHTSADALELYKTVQAPGTPQAMFTLKPKPFLLPELLEGKIKSFKASLYQGNFENKGKLLLTDIDVVVEKVLEVSHLHASNPPLASLHYFSLQVKGKSYLVHKISALNNFDQIVQVEWINDARPPVSTLTFNFPDNLLSKLKAGQYYSLDAQGSLTETSEESKAALKVVGEFYCTVGPDFFLPCE
ncbi:MAG TPA: hypothetical protein VE954_32670 [Oligoflexus sp.]|uniref:hypothetical protein n=1 Tax=Oligoflexus sp. TaxID=1971216 RepID=UPI002D657208|nr:hypothetical protein [Oligoflexus sp.]HYX37883.1 hypothetical protein [Oligoflexus sp.]